MGKSWCLSRLLLSKQNLYDALLDDFSRSSPKRNRQASHPDGMCSKPSRSEDRVLCPVSPAANPCRNELNRPLHFHAHATSTLDDRLQDCCNNRFNRLLCAAWVVYSQT